MLYSPEYYLVELGLETRGDLYALRSFCERKEKQTKSKDAEERKQSLIDKIRCKKVKHSSGPESQKKNRPSSSYGKPRKFELGWQHFSEVHKRFVAVRQSRGGGTRSVSMSGYSTISDILEEARNLFFPQGKSVYGNWMDMDCELANFKGEVKRSLTSHEGNVMDFSLQSYFELHKLTRVRLYLRTRQRGTSSISVEEGEPEAESETLGVLKGNSRERAKLREEQDGEYAESLRADRAKTERREQALKEELNKARKVEEIHAARLSRVLDEPTVDEPRVVVRVRHIDLGLVNRAFKPNQKMAAVYDWIGSLQLIPLYFSLSNTPGNVIDPSVSIDYSADKVLFMEQRDDPIPLSADDDEVSFKGFGEIGEIGMTPPSRLMAWDIDTDEEGCP